jgi:hypothetical protein
MEDYFMAENLKVTLPGGYTLALENVDAAGVPDITQNAGENVLQAEADAQKPVTQEGAEYDAAAEADKGKEIENVQQVASQESENAVVAELARENGNTFYGMHIMNAAKKSGEAFGITKAFKKMTFASVKEAVNSQEVKDALEAAKAWASKKGYTLSTVDEINKNKMTLGTLLFKRAGGAKAANGNGDQFVNGNPITKYKLHTVAGTGILALPAVLDGAGISEQANSQKFVLYVFFTKNGKVFAKKLAAFRLARSFATESYGVFAGLFAREAAEADAGEPNPAATDNPVTPAESDPETETDDVDVEEDVEVTAEPAPAATEPAAPATEPAPAAPATEPATEDDDAKAVESFYADFFKGWNK